MIARGLRLENFRPFAALTEMKLGGLTTIVGRNDAGKSSILMALAKFCESGEKVGPEDVHEGAGGNPIVIEVAFGGLPDEIEIEEGTPTTFSEEFLLHDDGLLRIRKTYAQEKLNKPIVEIVANDLDDERFTGLAGLVEKELNQRLDEVGLEVTKSGRGVTNKKKRADIRKAALAQGVGIGEMAWEVDPKSNLWKTIEGLMPEFEIFPADARLGVDETAFQSQFRPTVERAAEDDEVVSTRNAFEAAIGEALQEEIDSVFEYFRRHTDTITKLRVDPEFVWNKAVKFDILGTDDSGVTRPLSERGAGIRRLLMVAFFQYMAEREPTGRRHIFAVEEPENCLHPALQRELLASFREIADQGDQLVITSHSPVFAGGAPVEDLALVRRDGGMAEAIQVPELSLSDVAEELGVEPADQITGYAACVFVEGKDDIHFWNCVAQSLKEGGVIVDDFEDRNIGFVITGGCDNLKHWISRNALKRLNRRAAVVLDSDRKAAEHQVGGKKLRWKKECEADGIAFFILRKREIENYLHPEALKRAGKKDAAFDDFTDMKEMFGNCVCKVVETMSCEEILECDIYDENGSEGHELREIAEALLGLTEN